MREPDPQVAQLRQRAEDLAGDEVKAAPPRLERDLPLDPHGANPSRPARRNRLIGSVRQASRPHVHPLAHERHALRLEQRALASAPPAARGGARWGAPLGRAPPPPPTRGPRAFGGPPPPTPPRGGGGARGG